MTAADCWVLILGGASGGLWIALWLNIVFDRDRP